MEAHTQCAQCAQETDEQKLVRLQEYIDDSGADRHNLIQVLHLAQGLFGYLSPEVQQYIAEALRMPLSEVYGVVSFYSFFTTHPKGRYEIGVCLGTACYVRGGRKILQRLQDILHIGPGETSEDLKFSLEVMRCVGACGLAPVITINGEVHRQVSPDRLKGLLDELK